LPATSARRIPSSKGKVREDRPKSQAVSAERNDEQQDSLGEPDWAEDCDN